MTANPSTSRTALDQARGILLALAALVAVGALTTAPSLVAWRPSRHGGGAGVLLSENRGYKRS